MGYGQREPDHRQILNRLLKDAERLHHLIAVAAFRDAYDSVIAPQAAAANVDPLIKPRYARDCSFWSTVGLPTVSTRSILDRPRLCSTN